MNRVTSTLRELGVTRGDLLVTLMLLIISAVIGFGLWVTSPRPQYVLVKVDGTELCRLPLDQDRIYSIGDTNIIEISDGAISMTYADCPDKICVHTGKISQSGQAIVCAPNRVVVSITGASDGADVYTN